MKKKIIIISVVFIGFVLAITANSWAQRESAGKRHGDRGGHFQKWDKPAIHKFDRDRARRDHLRGHQNGPAKRFKPKFHKRHHYRAPHRFGPKYRIWRHRPTQRRPYPKRFFWRHRHSALNHSVRYYSTAESYAVPEEAFLASASVSDSGFSVSIGVSKTD
jgi:hypothetical protein